MKKMFSIIIPVYKVETYLKKCVDSILAQTFDDFELILVDDGSPDNCPTICDDYVVKDKRVKVIHKKNSGAVKARKTAILIANGDYICFVDGDDWIDLNLLEIVWKKAIKKYNPDMVVFNMIKKFVDTQTKIPCYSVEGIYNKARLENEIYPYMMYDCRKPFYTGLVFSSIGGKIFKRELLLDHYCKEERIRMGDDSAFVFECLYASDMVFFCDDYLYFYNQMNQNSIVHSYDNKRFENNQLLANYIENNLGRKNELLDAQINAFKAYWLIMAIFHEVKSRRKILESASHIKMKINQTRVLEGIQFDGLPKMVKLYLILLKVHMYKVSLLSAKIISKIRG